MHYDLVNNRVLMLHDQSWCCSEEEELLHYYICVTPLLNKILHE